MSPIISLLAQEPPGYLTDAPITTGAIFLALTGAITYLYRARDQDRESELERLTREIQELKEELREERRSHEK